jgi:prepilin-type processing-associated H-X9-DG protein/prepilin-type N-terminal cleavage/methylation domain-containing protein
MSARRWKAFSLVEVLVSVALVSLLTAILLPALESARSQARSAVCKSNLRQLFIANMGYTVENDGCYVPAAPDIRGLKGGMHRWHGVRESSSEPFDPRRGPLACYLGEGRVKECPAGAGFVEGGSWGENFEQGCGGYGYNHIYLGSRDWQARQFSTLEEMLRAGWETTQVTEVCKPGETLMFADTAMCVSKPELIEYSFAEPPFYVYKGEPMTGFYLSPSIHFRHQDRANVVWADGHTEAHQMADFGEENAYGVESAELGLGWFEPVNNTPFDLE